MVRPVNVRERLLEAFGTPAPAPGTTAPALADRLAPIDTFTRPEPSAAPEVHAARPSIRYGGFSPDFRAWLDAHGYQGRDFARLDFPAYGGGAAGAAGVAPAH